MAVDYFEVTVIPELLLGDYDGSGMVGAGDLGLVLGSWGSDMIPPEWVNQIPMGTVGAGELSVVLNEWGNSASLLAIPEPSSVVLMCLGLTAFVCRSR